MAEITDEHQKDKSKRQEFKQPTLARPSISYMFLEATTKLKGNSCVSPEEIRKYLLKQYKIDVTKYLNDINLLTRFSEVKVPIKSIKRIKPLKTQKAVPRNKKNQNSTGYTISSPNTTFTIATRSKSRISSDNASMLNLLGANNGEALKTTNIAYAHNPLTSNLFSEVPKSNFKSAPTGTLKDQENPINSNLSPEEHDRMKKNENEKGKRVEATIDFTAVTPTAVKRSSFRDLLSSLSSPFKSFSNVKKESVQSKTDENSKQSKTDENPKQSKTDENPKQSRILEAGYAVKSFIQKLGTKCASNLGFFGDQSNSAPKSDNRNVSQPERKADVVLNKTDLKPVMSPLEKHTMKNQFEDGKKINKTKEDLVNEAGYCQCPPKKEDFKIKNINEAGYSQCPTKIEDSKVKNTDNKTINQQNCSKKDEGCQTDNPYEVDPPRNLLSFENKRKYERKIPEWILKSTEDAAANLSSSKMSKDHLYKVKASDVKFVFSERKGKESGKKRECKQRSKNSSVPKNSAGDKAERKKLAGKKEVKKISKNSTGDKAVRKKKSAEKKVVKEIRRLFPNDDKGLKKTKRKERRK